MLPLNVSDLEGFAHSGGESEHAMRHEFEVIGIGDADVIRGTFEGEVFDDGFESVVVGGKGQIVSGEAKRPQLIFHIFHLI